MSAEGAGAGELTIEGRTFRFVPDGSGRTRVESGPDAAVVGALSLAPDGTSFVATTPAGTVLTVPSRWGGRVTARYATRELAVRALVESIPRR